MRSSGRQPKKSHPRKANLSTGDRARLRKEKKARWLADCKGKPKIIASIPVTRAHSRRYR